MDINKSKIKYEISGDKKIRLFGENFMKENKNKCKIEINILKLKKI